MSDNQDTSASVIPTIKKTEKFWKRFDEDFEHLRKNINELEQARDPAFNADETLLTPETRVELVGKLSGTVDSLLDIEKGKNDRPKIEPRDKLRDALKTAVIFENFSTEEIRFVTDMYVSYGYYYEYLYTMLLLYQVLLQEYGRLDLLEKKRVDEIRTAAVGKLAFYLCTGTWRGKPNFDNRTNFRDDMMKEVRGALREKRKDKNPQPVLSALCLSGGGIRSATFSLGLIQGLAKHGLLDKFTYLSTVSGGGYIGSWLTAWIHRRGDVKAVQSELVAEDKIEPPEVSYLRSYSNYMSPRVGLLSADTWALVGVYLRNLLLNWMVFVPFIAAFLLVPRMVEELVNNGGRLMGPPPSYAAGIFVTIGILLGIWGLFCVAVFRPSLQKFLPKPSKLEMPEGKGVLAVLKRLYFRVTNPLKWVGDKFLRTFDQTFVRDEIGIFQNNELKVVILCVLPITLFAAIVTTYWSWAGPDGERMLPVKDLVDFVNKDYNRFYLLGFFAIVFAIVLAAHWGNRKGGEFKSYWDKFFGSALILICMVISAALIIPPETNFKLFGLVVFAEAVYVASFLASRAVMYIFRKKNEVGDGTSEDKDSLSTNMAIEFGMSFLAASLGGLLFFVANDNLRLLYPISRDLDPTIEKFVKSLPGVSEIANFLPAAGPATNDLYTIFATPLFLLVFLISASVFVGIGSKIMNDMDREWLSRLGAWFLIIIAGWVAIFGLVLFGPELVELAGRAGRAGLASAGGIAGAITLLLGYYAKNAPQESAKPSKKKSSLLVRFAPQIAAPVFAAFLAILLVMLTSALIDFAGCRLSFLAYNAAAAGVPLCEPLYFSPEKAGLIVFAIWFIVLAAIGVLMGWWININKFSLHATYRERLIRAYLGASRARARLDTANSFTGLDEGDNIPMCNVFQQPFHLVNMTLNTAKSSKLNWQNRKSESFTATALHCGSSNMGDGSGTYRSSAVYGGAISLGTAAAISGAAASPNMGYYTQSAPVSALMALFNIRLGWWLGNPGRNGSETFFKKAPEWAPKLFFNEALGITGDTSPYVYLSDGGHFDNLGLYEVVLRRCRFVVVSDAAADFDFGFSDLGSAIHKIRVDMGIPIEFDPGDAPLQGRNCSVGTIKYSALDANEPDGVLIYIKPTLDGDEPVDIVNYKSKNPDFPHESTADQMYSETQFESYRSLGFHMIESICGKDHKKPCTNCLTLQKLEENVDIYLENFANKKAGTTRTRRRAKDKPEKEEPGTTDRGES